MDYPSKHQDGKLPILDLKVWMETKEKEIEGRYEKASVIMYEFHSKSMASKAVINARSAINRNTKRTVLTQEVLRVLLNCSRLLPWERVVENVNEMVLGMLYSSYNKKFRYEVVNLALKAYTEQERKLIKKENNRYIGPKSGERKNENRKSLERNPVGTNAAEMRQ